MKGKIVASTPAKKALPSLSSLTEKKDEAKVEETKVEKAKSNSNSNEDFNLDNDDNSEDQLPEAPEEPEDVDIQSSSVINKTPAELAAETPAETADRYNIDTSITDEDADNPRVQVYKDTIVKQVPSGTHLHPDIAKDLHNRGISEQHTDNAMVKREIATGYDFAPDAEHNDKF